MPRFDVTRIRPTRRTGMVLARVLIPMNAAQYRNHLQRIHSDYRALVETHRLEDLARELGAESWLPSTNGSSPSQVAIEVTHAIMAELYAAATERDERAARTALDRLRRFILSIPSDVG